MRKRTTISFLLLALLLFTTATPVHAQQPNGPIYIVQPGDTLYSIALRFNVSMDDLISVNKITDPNALAAGQQLIIPGMEGVTGVLQTELVNFGDSFRSLVRRSRLPVDLLMRMNHLLSPSQFYVGSSMIVAVQDNKKELTSSMSLEKGESLFELAVAHNTDPWTLSSLNELQGTWDGLPQDTLYATGDGTNQVTSGLPSAFVSAEIPTLPIKQGGTTELIVKPADGVTLSGTLVDKPLHFFPMGDGHEVALQGVYVLLDPGVYPLELNATLPDGTQQSFQQMVLVNVGDQPKTPVIVPPEDPTAMTTEDQQLASITSTFTPTRYWQDQFILPVGLPYCIKDWFGSPRSLSYNGSDFSYFHAGVDYGVCSADHPYDIYAAAPGVVVFTGLLPVRGNLTIIDNGWGVYTLYAHQKEFDVAVGQQVQAGQIIGQIGATGHVTGPHLHFEMWVGGVQVNPLEWLNRAYP